MLYIVSPYADDFGRDDLHVIKSYFFHH